MTKKLSDKTPVTSMTDEDRIAGLFGGELTTTKISDFVKHIKGDDELLLQQIAWYYEPNVAAAKGASAINIGGNLHMFAIFDSLVEQTLMDKNGNYCLLNPDDARYTEDDEAVVDSSTGEILSKWAHCDFMNILPEHYVYVQIVNVAGVSRERIWVSPMPIPNGVKRDKMVVARFKASVVGNVMRSLPNKVPTGFKTINDFWDCAQARSKDHGLANLGFRTFLLEYMFCKYGQRDSQNCTTTDGTLVWGVGIDGSESTSSDKFSVQKSIVTGHTLSLGRNDGKVAVADANGTTVHGVNVLGFENPWGQYWEMVQGLCSVGNDVYCWNSNWLPTGTPDAASFAKVDHVTLHRYVATNPDGIDIKCKYNVVTSADKQGLYPVPASYDSALNYGDHYWYASNGQQWMWGGVSSGGAGCGLACPSSNLGWSSSFAYVSARLAFYGTIKEVTKTKLATV